MLSWLVWLCGLTGLLIAGNLLIHFLYALIALRRFENAPLLNVAAPPDDAPSGERLVIATPDGLELNAVAYFPADGIPSGVIVFCPETGGTAATCLNYIPSLLDRGAVVVAFDFRGQGLSTVQPGYRANCWMTEFELSDLRAVINFVKSQPQFEGLPLGLVGISRGANAALAVAAENPEIRHIWSQGAFLMEDIVFRQTLRSMEYVAGSWTRLLPRWHIRTTLWLMFRICEFHNGFRFPRLGTLLPKLDDREMIFLSGARDSYFPPESTEALCRATGHSPDKCVWIVPGAKHNLERMASPEEYDRRMAAFFAPLLQPESVVLAELA